jgi:RND family efflux transporter MFP subunit
VPTIAMKHLRPVRPLGKLSLTAAVSSLLIGLGLSGCGRLAMTPTGKVEPPAPRVGVIIAEKRDVPVIRRPDGVTRAVSDVTIRARVQGFLQKREFTEGDYVKKGSLLLVIDEEPFAIRVAQAQAVFEEAKAALRKANTSKAREISQAQLALDKTDLELDRIEERRERSLLARKAASQDDYDRARAKAEKSEAQVQSSTASLEQARADYETNILGAEANLQKAKADLDSARIELGYCRMFAPIEGRIGELQVKLGNLVGAPGSSSDTTSLVTIQQLDPMGVDLRPASRYLPFITERIKSGVQVRIRVQGRRMHPHVGKITFVDNHVDPTTSTVLVKAEIPNPDHSVLPGEYVKAYVDIGDYAGALVVPAQAVIEAQEGSRVYVVDAQNIVQVSLVKSVDSYNGLAVLESGLEPGQKVIVEGVQLVRPGQKVQVEELPLSRFERAEDETQETDALDSPLIRLPGAGNPPRGSSGPESPESKKQDAARPAGGTSGQPAPSEKTTQPGSSPRE